MKFLRPRSYFLLLALAIIVCGINLAQDRVRNVNVISGNKNEYGGDRFQQRQNEPMVAVSSRNPDHLLAAANDYRTVDLVAPQEPSPEFTAEAWLGVYRSYDRGRTWITGLLPGFPQDRTAAGRQSPIFGLKGASDPVLASGLNGRIYLGGLAFNREDESVIFVARYTDLNNFEGGDTFRYDFNKVLASRRGFPKGKLEDKPAIGIDIPRNSTSPTACESVYVTYTEFKKIKPNGNFSSNMMFTRSTDCGQTWAKPIQLNKGAKDFDDKRSQGSAIAVDPADGTIYVAWRIFDSSNFVALVKSTDGGRTFTNPISVTGANPIFAFDQYQPLPSPGTNPYDHTTFRSNAFPTVAVDTEGRVHVAWQERVSTTNGVPQANGVPRIVTTTSSDTGSSWTPRRAFDYGTGSGPQVMPSLTVGRRINQFGVAETQLMLLFYEAGKTNPNSNSPELSPSTGFISGIERTMEVRVAQAGASANPQFTKASQPVSQYYAETATGTVQDVPGAPGYQQVNRPNLPMYQNGTTAFMGDYIHLTTGVPFVNTSQGWQWAVNAAKNGFISAFDFSYHAVWTDNRDVVFPSVGTTGFNSLYGNWARYSAPGTGAPSCENPSSRNANIYSAEITKDVIVGSPGTFKQLGVDQNGKPIQRAFIMYVKNQDSQERKLFRLTIVDQRNANPPVVGSFYQTADRRVLDIVVFPNSTVTQAVYASSANPVGSVTVEAVEFSNGSPTPGGFKTSIGFNTDPSNAQISNPQISNVEIHNAQISNPQISNPQISNPQISNPQISNAQISNPQISNAQISNPQISNPQISNPQISNAPLADVNWTVTNEGNTTSAYTPLIHVSQVTQQFPGYQFQLVIYRTTIFPSASGCQSTAAPLDSIVSVIKLDNAQISNPQISNAQISNPQISNPQISNATFFVAPADPANPNLPRDAVKVTLRIFPPEGTDLSSYPALFDQKKPAIEQVVSQTIVAESINTIGGELASDTPNVATPAMAPSALLITTLGLPNGNLNVPYSINIEAAGGTGPRTWISNGSLPPGLNLTTQPSGNALLSGTPSQAGTFNFTVSVSDSGNGSSAQTNNRDYTLVISTPNTATAITAASPNPSVFGQTVTFNAVVASNAGTPTGTVSFFDNGTKIGAAPLTNGQATFNFSSLPVGAHTVTAAYASDNNNLTDSTSAPITVIVNQPPSQPTTTTITASETQLVAGQPLALVAQVSAARGVPTGSVTFRDNGTVIGTATVNPVGQASITPGLLMGSHSITATYGGNEQTSTSSALTLTVGQAATATELTASPNPSAFGQATTFTATVKALPPSEGSPTGTVTFRDGSVTLGTATLNAARQATLAVSTLANGARSITAVYSGDSSFAASTSEVFTQTVNQSKNPSPTTTTISASVNPTVADQPVVFTVRVSSSGGIPTGSVTLQDNGLNITTATLDGAGQASFTVASLDVGAHPMRAVYSGDPNFNPSTSAVLTQTVGQANTSISLVTSKNPSRAGEAVTFTATLNTTASIGTPTGVVTFKDGGVTLGTGPITVVGGQRRATLPGATLSVGSHSITAEYTGDINFGGSASAALSQVVNQANSFTSLASSQNPSVFGQPVTFTATVIAVAPGAGTPTGTVTFKDGVNTLGTSTLNAGQATFTTSALTLGAHSVTAVYGSDVNFLGSTSSAINQVVNQASTSTSLASSQNPSTFGQPVTFTATVAAVAPGAGTPDGTVTFKDGAATLGTVTLSAGQATLTSPTLSVGSHSITALYDGDANFLTSTSSPLTQTVNQVATATAVSSSLNPSIFGQSVTFTATVSPVAPGSGTPTGSVTFMDGAATLGTGAVNGAGQASFATTSLSFGSHSITAVYGGSTNFSGSTSSALSQTVKGTVSVNLNSSQNPSTSGQSINFTATVAALAPAVGTPTGSVQFKLDGANFGAPVALSGGSATSGNLSSLTPGTYLIEAVYSGDASFVGGSNSLAQTVNAATTTTLSSSLNPTYGAAVTFTATVSAVAPATGTPTGTVTFKDGGATLGTGMLNASGQATLTVTLTESGVRSITAEYDGQAGLLPSASAVLSQVVVPTSVFFGGVTINAVNVNGTGTNRATVAAGSSFTVSFNYSIFQDYCQFCIDQIEIGLNTGIPTQCVYSGIPPLPPGADTGSPTVTLTAPTTPGDYYIVFDRAQHFSCGQALNDAVVNGRWWNLGAPPVTRNFFAAIRVQ